MNHVFVVQEKNINDAVELYNKLMTVNKTRIPMAIIGIYFFLVFYI